MRSKLAYTDFLELLVEDELNKRRGRLFARHLKQARVPEIKHLEEFDWSFNPKLPKALIFDLATARFITQHGGVLLLGPPGTGNYRKNLLMERFSALDFNMYQSFPKIFP